MALNEVNGLREIKDEPEWADGVQEPECYLEEVDNSRANDSVTNGNSITSLDPNVRLKDEFRDNTSAKAGPSAFNVGRLVTPDELQDQIDQMDPAIVASIAPSKLILNLSQPTPRKRPKPHPNDPRPRPYACTMCDYRTTQNAHLKRHITTHTGEKPFSCNLCSFQTSQNSNYTRHMLTHSGEKPFSCSVCDYRTGYSSALKEHMRIHTGEKPYKCNVCDYKCSHSAHLKRHSRIHTGERPYACKVCNYRSSDYSALKSHVIRTHSGSKPLALKNIDNAGKGPEGGGRIPRNEPTEPPKEEIPENGVSSGDTRNLPLSDS